MPAKRRRILNGALWPKVALAAAVCLLSAEALLRLGNRFSWGRLPTEAELSTLVQHAPDIARPIYLPHPYFGYIGQPHITYLYTPGDVAFPTARMNTNWEGFVDDEFPHSKKKGECIYALMGGSAAMSYGVPSREERLSTQLERLLNAARPMPGCASYRVLNMGLQSQLQIQATNIFLYYQHLLDGVIFYGGYNEIIQINTLWSDDYPDEYPMFKVDQLHLSSFPDFEAARLRKRETATAQFFLDHPHLLRFGLGREAAKILLAIDTRLIDKASREFVAQAAKEGARMAHIAKIEKPDFEAALLKHSPGVNEADPTRSIETPELVQKAFAWKLRRVFTDPLINAYGVAKLRKKRFMAVIQPMPAVVRYANPYKYFEFQRLGNEALIRESQKLEDFGIKVHNLNEDEHLFDGVRGTIFIDSCHITGEANGQVANRLLQFIQSEWR